MSKNGIKISLDWPFIKVSLVRNKISKSEMWSWCKARYWMENFNHIVLSQFSGCGLSDSTSRLFDPVATLSREAADAKTLRPLIVPWKRTIFQTAVWWLVPIWQLERKMTAVAWGRLAAAAAAAGVKIFCAFWRARQICGQRSRGGTSSWLVGHQQMNII